MRLAWGKKVSRDFAARLINAAMRDGYDPSHAMAAMWFESKLNPQAVNALSGATGLIQFMPSTALDLNTTVDALARMNAEEQLDYVERYFHRYAGRISNLHDLYMCILWPKAVGQPDSFVLFEKGSKAYEQNKSLDLDGDGKITKYEACAFVRKSLSTGLLDENASDDSIIDATTLTSPKPTTSTETIMGPLAILSMFAPVLKELIPQISSILKPNSEVANRNVALAETLVGTIVKTAGAANMQEAVEKMQSSPEVKQAVQKAVVTEPIVMATLQITEVGGGIAGARQADLAMVSQDKPFYKTSAVFWMSVILIPMVYWLVGSIIVGGGAQRVANVAGTYGDKASMWLIFFLSLFGDGWTGEARSGAFNLVIGLVLGGICGVYYGISVTQQRQQQPSAPTPQKSE